MISPSENVGLNTGMRNAVVGAPVRLVDEGVRAVSRLEFYPLERVEISEEQEPAAAEVILREELTALDGRLRSEVEEVSARVEMARSEARIESRREWEQELAAKIAVERETILKAAEEFRRERARYFAAVEAEVVKLALAIAARVLHRESMLDPMLLTGVVRVALEKVSDNSATVLRVPVDEVERWRGIFMESLESSLQLVGDERLNAGECVLDTNVGRVELGVSAQLEEIERGFFDLMQQRPS
ncbi:MAG: FliH/SctL family protein [Edaphobacter sp.]